MTARPNTNSPTRPGATAERLRHRASPEVIHQLRVGLRRLRSLITSFRPVVADARLPADASLADGISCDEAGCVAPIAGGGLVTLALRPDALADDCARAALIVTSRQSPPTCAAAVIPADRLRRQGALALRRTRDGFTIDAVRPQGFDRPWSPAVAGENEAEPYLVRSAVPRAVDATPAEADLQAEE